MQWRKNEIGIGGVAYSRTGSKNNPDSNLLHLLEILEDINRSDGLDEVITKIGEAAKEIMHAQASSLLLLDSDSDELCFTFCTGPMSEEIRGKCIPRDHGFSGWVVEHKLPLIANDLDDEHNSQGPFGGYMVERFAAQNLISAPLLDKENNVIGVIEAVNRRDKRKLTKDDMSVFQMLANHAGMAIERFREKEKQAALQSDQIMHFTEIHHRVKNDLALLSGIVEIESFDVEDSNARHVLQNIQSRIKSMAVVYELLSDKSARKGMHVGTYFKELAEGISKGLNSKKDGIDINIQADSVILDPYKSLSCGLILNELMLNTFKHAFPERKEGTITITLKKQEDNMIRLDYLDDGPGLPKDFDINNQGSLGFNMIDALAKKMEGEITIIEDDGAHFMIRFPANSTPKNVAPVEKDKIASLV